MKQLFAKTFAVISALAVIAGCSKSHMDNPSKDNVIRMTVSLDKPALEGDTRISVSGTTLSWDGDESVGVIFAVSSTDKTAYTQELKSVKGCPGVFSGDINLGSYTADDIIGIVYPYSDESWGRYKSPNFRIVMKTSSKDQVQATSGVLNCANTKLFAEVSKTDFVVSGNTYTLGGKTLKWANSFLQFNVYGKHAEGKEGEKLQSVKIESTATVAFVGTAEWNCGGTSFTFNGAGDTEQHILTKLTTPETIGATLPEAASIFTAVLPRSKSTQIVNFTKVTVVTDKAIYEKTINQSPFLYVGKVLPVSLDLATFDSRTATTIEQFSFDVSFDGGESWTKEIPVAFTSLKTKGEVTDAQIGEIALAIKNNTAKVDLDMSGSTLTTSVWPKAPFCNTADSPNAWLKSIKFPSNVNEIAAGASSFGAFTYCTGLEGVDLTGFVKIGRDAFTYSGIKSLNVPKTVTTIGNQAFRFCLSLETVYYDAPAATGTYLCAGGDSYYQLSHSVDMVVTIGHDVTSLPTYFVFGNPNLSKIVFEGSPAIGGSMMNKSLWLDTIEFETETPPTQASTAVIYGTTTSSSVTGAKKLIVPAGASTAYDVAPWSGMVKDLGFIIEEK